MNAVETISDATILEHVLAALFQSTYLTRERIQVAVHEGRVTLSGTVESDRLTLRAGSRPKNARTGSYTFL